MTCQHLSSSVQPFQQLRSQRPSNHDEEKQSTTNLAMLIEAYNSLQWIPSNWNGVVAVAEWFSMELPATRCEVINQASMQEEQMQSQIACAEQKKASNTRKWNQTYTGNLAVTHSSRTKKTALEISKISSLRTWKVGRILRNLASGPVSINRCKMHEACRYQRAGHESGKATRTILAPSDQTILASFLLLNFQANPSAQPLIESHAHSNPVIPLASFLSEAVLMKPCPKPQWLPKLSTSKEQSFEDERMT